MKYQLVLQWPAFAVEDYDSMTKIEDILIEKLTDANEVDGHDIGTGETNIFILTDDPERSFSEVKAILNGNHFWGDMKIAFRELSKSDYTVLWPINGSKFKVR